MISALVYAVVVSTFGPTSIYEGQTHFDLVVNGDRTLIPISCQIEEGANIKRCDWLYDLAESLNAAHEKRLAREEYEECLKTHPDPGPYGTSVCDMVGGGP